MTDSPRAAFHFSSLSLAAEMDFTGNIPQCRRDVVGWTWKVDSASCQQLYKGTGSASLPPFLPLNRVMGHVLMPRKAFSPFPMEKRGKIGKKIGQK